MNTNTCHVNITMIENPDDNCTQSEVNALITVFRDALTCIVPTRASEVWITLSDSTKTPKNVKDFQVRLGRCERFAGKPEKWAGEFTTASKKVTLIARIDNH